MNQDTAIKRGRNTERIFLLLNTLVLGLLFVSLHTVLRRDFDEADKRLRDGTIVNLNDKNPALRVKNLLEKGYYLKINVI